MLFTNYLHPEKPFEATESGCTCPEYKDRGNCPHMHWVIVEPKHELPNKQKLINMQWKYVMSMNAVNKFLEGSITEQELKLHFPTWEVIVGHKQLILLHDTDGEIWRKLS